MAEAVLVNPPSTAFDPLLPLGLAYIGSVLEKGGVTVKAVDAWALRMDAEAVAEAVAREKPGIVGITMMSPRASSALHTAATIKERCGDIPIVVGSHHPSALAAELLKTHGCIDIAAIGEGEYTMIDLVRALRDGRDLSGVRGIAYRSPGGEIVRTGKREPIQNLDLLPYPARHLFPNDRYRIHPPYGMKNPYATMVTIRGCPYGCIYCSKAVFGSRIRAQSPRAVVDEIEFLLERYRVKELKFYDDDFTLLMKRAGEICDEILRRGVRISWSCTTRVDLVDEELLRKMKEAGCWLIAYGVESASQEILDRARKGYNVSQVRDAFRVTRELGIKIHAYFMVGLPGETQESIGESIELAKELEPDTTSWGPTVVFPGTPLYREVEEGRFPGTRPDPYESKEGDLGEFAFGDGRFLLLSERLTAEELSRAVRRAYVKFYLRPRFLFSTLGKIRSPSDLKYYILAAWEFFRQVFGS